MLYSRWQKILSGCRNEIALVELATGRKWTFSQLGDWTEATSEPSGPIAFPSTRSAEFVRDVLGAWQRGKVVCPLEPDQTRPVLEPISEQIVHLKMTSATTGHPKLVGFTAPQLIADADNIVATMELRADAPNLGVISLAHSYGFSNLVTPLLLHGIPLILLDSALPEGLRQAASQFRFVTLPAVPALWRVWQDAGAVPENIRLAISAGAPLPLPLERELFNSCRVKLHNFYGATECGGIAFDSTELPRDDASYVGRPLNGVVVRTSADGCLEVSGPAVGETYLPDAMSTLAQGTYQTSDLAEVREDGIWLVGRANDQINVAGRKLSPEVVENVLRSHPQVKECIVFGAPAFEADRSEAVVACVSASSNLPVESLREFLLAKLPAWQLPRHWWFVDELPVNERGKVARAAWRARYLAERKGHS